MWQVGWRSVARSEGQNIQSESHPLYSVLQGDVDKLAPRADASVYLMGTGTIHYYASENLHVEPGKVSPM